MHMKRFVAVLCVLGSVGLAAAGCTSPNAPEPGNGDPAALAGTLLHTEKNMPDFEHFVEAPVVMDLAGDDEAFAALWEKYRLEAERPDVDFSAQLAWFVATGESGTCPLLFKESTMTIAENGTALYLSADIDGEICTDDWTPRSFVVVFPAAEPLVEPITGRIVAGSLDQSVTMER